MILGSALVISHFFFFRYLNKIVVEDESLSDFQEDVYELLIGALSGVVIFIFEEIYNYLCATVADWENHRLESDKESSYLVKTFVFNFFVSYMLLFYYAFADASITGGNVSAKFNTLGINFVAMVATKNLSIIGKVNLFPFVLYYIKKRNLYKKWAEYRKTLKAQHVS